jgi:hypothetical protein
MARRLVSVILAFEPKENKMPREFNLFKIMPGRNQAGVF